MSIATQITALTTDKTNIRNAIIAKGGACAETNGFDDFAIDIASIPSGGGTPYSGEYEVTPSQETQTLLTADRYLARHITVNPIPTNYGLITYNGFEITIS